MLLIKPVNHTAFRDVMDAYHRLFKTHEAQGAIPDAWDLEDPNIRKDAILVNFGNIWGIIYDGNYRHARKTLKNRHQWENYEWQNT